MKKSVRLVATLMAALMMVLAIGKSASAASYSWTAVKTPGTIAYGTTTITIPLYKGEMTFKLTNLYGDCSYLLARVASSNEDYYYVDNSIKSVPLTQINGEQTFYMAFTSLGEAQSNMVLIGSVEHNAGYSQFVEASGEISY